MAAYDPKRPRPSASAGAEPAPVDALLDPDPESTPQDTASRPAAVVPDVPDGDVLEVDLRPRMNGSAARMVPEVPVAPAPEEGTANRAVMIAAISASALVVALLAIWALRRRQH